MPADLPCCGAHDVFDVVQVSLCSRDMRAVHPSMRDREHLLSTLCWPLLLAYWVLAFLTTKYVFDACVQVAANDEICKSFAESGGVSALLQLLSAATEAGPPELLRGAAAALRQLANSDSIKAQLAEEGVLPVLLR